MGNTTDKSVPDPVWSTVQEECTICHNNFNQDNRRQVCLPCRGLSLSVRHCDLCLQCVISMSQNGDVITCPTCQTTFDIPLLMYTLNENCLWHYDTGKGGDEEDEREHPGKRRCLDRLTKGVVKKTPLSKTALEIAIRETLATLLSLRSRFHASNVGDEISPGEFMKVYIPDPEEYNEKWKHAGYSYHVGDPIPFNIAALVIGPVFGD